MAFKPNYNQARAERDRLKREKKARKLEEQQERTAKRKRDEEAGIAPQPEDETDC